MEKHRVSLFTLVLLAACGGKALDPPPDAGDDVKGDALECSSPADCLAPRGPCAVCPDGGTACPTVDCVAGSCVVSSVGCAEVLCPSDPPLNEGCSGSMRCTYGTETCCGQTYPSLVCDCSGGQFACYNTDACFLPPGGCPDGGPVPECTSDGDCAVPAICMTCPDGSCVPPVAVCRVGACDVDYPPCP